MTPTADNILTGRRNAIIDKLMHRPKQLPMGPITAEVVPLKKRDVSVIWSPKPEQVIGVEADGSDIVLFMRTPAGHDAMYRIPAERLWNAFVVAMDYAELVVPAADTEQA